MAEINLLKAYPKTQRDIKKRHAARTGEQVALARQYGKDYFDGSRETGYGGYTNDGRWVPVAADLKSYFLLWPGCRTLDIGCAKGFLVNEQIKSSLRLEAFGLDISEYALMNCAPDVVGRLHLGNCIKLPFPDDSFAMVTAINVLHDLDRADCIKAVREIQRVSNGRAYIQVDSYRTLKERDNFLSWVLTARIHYWPSEWQKLFNEAGYTGDYYWTLIE